MRTIPYSEHMATFNGRHNRVKARLLVFLYDRQVNFNNTSSLGLVHLQQATGIDYHSLASLLYRWHRWHYVTRRLINCAGSLVWGYSLASRGKVFVEYRIPDEILGEVRHLLYDEALNQIRMRQQIKPIHISLFSRLGLHYDDDDGQGNTKA